jgi:O-antigen biosynthesis protein
LLTSIIILTHNQLDYTKLCIESIRKFTKSSSYEIIVVDNCSTDGTLEWLKQQKDLKIVINSENEGFPKGCNQGIEVTVGNSILLLNNDTIVTENWLDNLLTCLNSSDDIGAVGPVTNSAAYFSTIPVNYTSIDEMYQFATNYNVTDPVKWEERLKLIGFCMLIKKEAIKRIGLLDERFTPGNFEDDDFSIRLRQAGYRLMLCKDTFIHHFGSVSWKKNINAFSNVLKVNEKKFKEKWGIDSSAYNIDLELINLIEFSKEKPIKVLHINCGSGGTLLKVKREFPFAKLYGIETNLFSVEEANTFSKVTNNLDHAEIVATRFDIILFSGGSFKLNSSLFEFIKERLLSTGKFIAKIPNMGNYHVIQELNMGHNPFEELEMYSFSQVERMMKDMGFEITITGLKSYISNEQQQFIDQHVSIGGDDIRPILESSYFMVLGHIEDNQLVFLLNNIVSKHDCSKKVLKKLNDYSIEQVVKAVRENYQSFISIVNQIAIENFTMGFHDNVLPYLETALGVEPNDTDTLYNLGFVLDAYSEKELANQFLSRIKNPDEEVRRLIDETKESPITTI